MRKKTTTKVTMTKRKILTIIWTALVIAALSACGSSYTSESSKASEDENTKSDAEKEETAIYETPAVENGEISINADTLTSSPMYINYDSIRAFYSNKLDIGSIGIVIDIHWT